LVTAWCYALFHPPEAPAHADDLALAVAALANHRRDMAGEDGIHRFECGRAVVVDAEEAADVVTLRRQGIDCTSAQEPRQAIQTRSGLGIEAVVCQIPFAADHEYVAPHVVPIPTRVGERMSPTKLCNILEAHTVMQHRHPGRDSTSNDGQITPALELCCCSRDRHSLTLRLTRVVRVIVPTLLHKESFSPLARSQQDNSPRRHPRRPPSPTIALMLDVFLALVCRSLLPPECAALATPSIGLCDRA